jgi:hypothetical protein
MKNNLLTLTFLSLATLLSYSPSQAQTYSTVTGTEFITGGNSGDYGSFEWRDNGILISKGTGTTPTSSLLSTDQGAGTRFLWYPKKAALRAGIVSGTQWDEANVGQSSVAFGLGTIASGNSSFAAGWFSSATGMNSVALGAGTTSSGLQSVAIGGGAGLPMVASGRSSFVVGGLANTASGDFASIVGGTSSIASGLGSLVLGGLSNSATGTYSVATGSSTKAESNNLFVIGRYNVGGYTNNNNGITTDDGDTQWIATDPLFEIGNGTSSTTRSNALTVYKNGNMSVKGAIRIPASGDLSMGEFTAGQAP